MAKKYYWLKLKSDFFSSRAMKKLRRIAGGDTYTIIYLKLQLLSLKDEGLLYYEGVEPTFYEEMALALDEEVDNVRATLIFLENMGLLEQKSDSEYILTEVPYLIGGESESAERVRRYREKKALEIEQDDKKALQCNGNVTNCNTEIEIEKEIEIDKEIDKEKSKRDSKGEKRKRFVPPTLEEVQAYCVERGNSINAQHFINHYTSQGWHVGKAKMKDWKAAVRTWEQREFGNNKSNYKPNTSAQELDDFYNMSSDWVDRMESEESDS